MVDDRYIDNFVTHFTEIWTAAHAKWERMDALYWRTYAVWSKQLSASRPSYRPSTAANLVDHAIDNQMAYSPLVERPKVGRGQLHEERADKLEPFLTAVLEEAALREPLLTWKQAGSHLLHYGYTVIFGPRLDMKGRPEEPHREEGEGGEDFEAQRRMYENERLGWNPLRISAPHPSRVLMDPWEKQPEEAVFLGVRLAGELDKVISAKRRKGLMARVFPWGRSNGDDPYEEIRIAEFWDVQRHILKIQDGDILVDEENSWGFVPFCHAFSGWGRELVETPPQSAQSLALGPRDPQYLAVGLLEHLDDDIVMQAQSFSAKHHALMGAAFVPYGTRKAPEEFGANLARQGILEGDRLDYWVMEYPQLPAWLFRIGEELERDIEAGSYARAMRGEKEAGVTTVGQQAILTESASKKFLAPQQQLEHLASITAGRVLRLVDVLGESLTVRGITVRPQDVEHNYTAKVRFELINPMVQMAQKEQGMREVDMGLKSAETYRANDARIQDEVGERKRILQEKIRQHPAVVEAAVKVIAREMGLEKVIEEWEKKQKKPAPSLGGRGLEGQPLPPRQPLTEAVAKPPQPEIAGLGRE